MSEQNGLNPFLNSRRNAGILAIFALVTTLAIALTFTLTKDTIAEQKQAKLLAVIFDVVNRDKIANDIQDNCLVLPDVAALGNKTDLKAYRGYNEAGKLTSVAMQSVAPNGYSGDIRFLVGLASDFSTITGVRVLEHQETPGLGDKIDLRISDWILDFTNTTATTENVKAWAVKKEGGQFDAFTGATITPRALVQAIHKTALYAQNNAEFIRTATNVCAEGDVLMQTQYKELTWQGLWNNNPALVQLLGLCPLLAVTTTAINGLGLGLATLIVLMGSNITVSLVRELVPNEIRIPIFVMVIAAFVTVVQLLMNAFTYELYLTLGIFIPLIVTNCAIIGRAEAFASKNTVSASAYDGFIMGVGFAIVLVLLGAMRELLGNGTILSGAHLLLGDWAYALEIQIFEFEQAFLLAILPPGAFIGMGLIIALKNVLHPKLEQTFAPQPEKVVERARVTLEDS